MLAVSVHTTDWISIESWRRCSANIWWSSRIKSGQIRLLYGLITPLQNFCEGYFSVVNINKVDEFALNEVKHPFILVIPAIADFIVLLWVIITDQFFIVVIWRIKSGYFIHLKKRVVTLWRFGSVLLALKYLVVVQDTTVFLKHGCVRKFIKE